ncbi:uncharacterized protein LOC103701838 isoform X1 [Phoenix dactylifera]|uniref:Uncharacterized protein LOC103701838 isoform X1 n=2 Tax=Phoenix dactylifera TaxID=42345 RepID=A0A8B9AH38_PHODC|nr:uncharacterized protein LOC103701838 isoform X1 [Phoenix dactylifera]
MVLTSFILLKMARSTKSHHRRSSHKVRLTPYPLPSFHRKNPRAEENPRKASLALEKKDWEDAICPVCMEFPHYAVLLLCSSHDKGCRPYMCGTTYHFSNCLDQFQKAYAKEISTHDESVAQNLSHGLSAWKKSEVMELTCPLCRGQVKGWTVVEPAREHLNRKKRSCMQDNCSFTGTYKELQKHVEAEHPFAEPRAVDPAHEQKWRALEYQHERADVLSTIRSSMPRAVVFGDYVIDMDDSERETDDDGNGIFEGNRSIIYLILREAARLGRQNRITGVSEVREEGDGLVPVMATAGGAAADLTVDHPSEEYDVSIMDAIRSGRQQRRRQLQQRRRRRRGRSVS